MKANKFNNILILIFYITSILISSANAKTDNNIFKTQPSAVYQSIHNKSLSEALDNVSKRTGIAFKINPDITSDKINKSIQANNWDEALKLILDGYNYTYIIDSKIKTVIVSGKNNNSHNVSYEKKPIINNDTFLEINNKHTSLPKKYEGFPENSVIPIDLPIDSLMIINERTIISLDLPMGQFNVFHDRTVNENDGSKTWIGYLNEEGEGYRVFLSKGDGGVMGVITTPDGTYNVESEQSGIYVVDTKKLSHAGYEGDSITPSTIMMDAISMKASTSTSDQLKKAVDKAKKTLDSTNSLFVSYTTRLNAYSIILKNITNAYNAEASKLASYQAIYESAAAAYKTAQTTVNRNVLNKAITALKKEKNDYSKIDSQYKNIKKVVTSFSSQVNILKSSLAKAQANYDQALKALDMENHSTSAPSPSAPESGENNTPIVDLMVLYTINGQTAAYAKQRIALLVTVSNQAYIDSGINMKLRLVYTEPTDYIENNSNSQALDDLSNDRGVFAGVSDKRVQFGADLVFLFRPLHAQTAGSCGTTYVEFANGSVANKWLGYGTIGDGNSKDNLKGYYCASNTFTHEIGHSLGLVHDRENSSFSGVFDYSYAWGVQGTFATIMSYKQPVVMYFSTPTLTNNCAGQPCGYPETDTNRSSDQVKSVNYTAPIVANFMATTIAEPVLK